MALGPLPVAPGIAKIRLIYTFNGRAAVNVFHVLHAIEGMTLVQAQAAVNSIYTLTNTHIKPLVGPAAALNSVEFTDLTTRTSPVATNTTGWTGTASTGTGLPNNIACCVSFLTAYRFRGGHARLYLPAQGSTSVSGGFNWTGTWVTTVKNGMEAFRAAMPTVTIASNPLNMVMLSYFTHDSAKNPIYHADGPHEYFINAVTVHQRIDSQRRRLGKETT